MSSLKNLDPAIYKLLAVSFVAKVILGVFLPLAPDEAYYWVWSHKLQLSYYDHPAFVAWLNLLGQPFENFYSGIRLPALVMSHGSLLLWIVLLRDTFSQKQLFWWLALALAMPFTGTGGMIVTPDIPLLFFWTLTLALTKNLIRIPTPSNAMLAGLSLGLGFVSKYTMILMVPIVLLWLFTSLKDKTVFIRSVALGIIGAVIASFPVWYWNLTNDLTSVGFQLGHGLSGGFEIKNPLEYLGGQLAFLAPPIVWFAWRARNQVPRWLLVAGAFPLCFFGLSSFFSASEVNWPLVAHPAILAMGIFGMPKLPNKWLTGTMGVFALVTGLVILQVLFDWLPREDWEVRTDEIGKFTKVAEYVKGKENIYARSYQMASAVSFANKTMFYKVRGMNRVDGYDFFPDSEPEEHEFQLILRTDEKFKKIVRKKYEIVSREVLDKRFDVATVRKR